MQKASTEHTSQNLHLGQHVAERLSSPLLSIVPKSPLSCWGWSTSSRALLLSLGGTGSPAARECWCCWMGPQCFQHTVSPGPQSPELAPLAAYCVHCWGCCSGGNLFLSSTVTTRHCCYTWPDITLSQVLGLGTRG